MRKIILVGELNPYGADPQYALYPLPRQASGARLQEILAISTTDYLKGHDRVNLCTGTYDPKRAAAYAQQLHTGREFGTGLVLCGVRVAAAFRAAAALTEDELKPFSLGTYAHLWYLTIPHPSGRNRAWNAPDAADRARVLYDLLRERVGYELKIPRSE